LPSKLSFASVSAAMRGRYQIHPPDALTTVQRMGKNVRMFGEIFSADSKRPMPPDIAAINRRFYDALWSGAHLERPERFNTWSLVSELLPSVPARLEIGPGLRPRLPIAGTHFIDISPPVIERLKARGGFAVPGEIGLLPFNDQTFDLVCAFDVIEHVEDDRRAFAEVSRVLKDDGVLILSVPVHADHWTEFDDWVGHVRRYDLPDLLAIMSANQLTLQKSAVFGMQPRHWRLVRYGMSWLKYHRREAMFWYNWVGMPLALLFQRGLKLVSGLVDATGVDEVVLVCRRRLRSPASSIPGD
jgi:SAM-dependent methyltransferase